MPSSAIFRHRAHPHRWLRGISRLRRLPQPPRSHLTHPGSAAGSADAKPEEPPAESEQETAPARGQRAQQEQSDEEDVVSDDDERIENSVHIGLRAIEKIIGGKVIDERPLHQI